MNDLDRAALRFTQASCTGDEFRARRHFEAGWRIALPVIQMVARAETKNWDTADDAISRTALKMWVHLRRKQRTIGGGYIKTVAKTCSLDALSAVTRHEHARDEITDDMPTPSVDADTETMFEQLAALAESRFQKPLWAAILRQIAEGHDFRVDIAYVLGANQNTVRCAFLEMRRSTLFESLAPPGSKAHTDVARIVEHVYDTWTQLCLFEVVEQPTARTKRPRRTARTAPASQSLFDSEVSA